MKIASWSVFVVGTGVAFAQPKDPRPPPVARPVPAASLGTLKKWVRTWNCTGTAAGDKRAAKLIFRRELDNFWYSAHLEVAKTATVPVFISHAMFGADPVTKDWITRGFDNAGGVLEAKATLTWGKSGDEANGMSWDGELRVSTGKQPVRFDFDLANDGTLSLNAKIAGKDVFTYSCR
jgi:hypothetical protein